MRMPFRSIRLLGVLLCAALCTTAAAQTRADTFSDRLRDVVAVAMVEDGTVYALEGTSGRVVQLSDRGRDGRADSVRRFPHRFETPQALTIQDGRVFIADARGVWGLRAQGTPELIASLDNAGTTDRIHLAAGEPGRLVLGLTRDGEAQLIELDIASGRAEMLARTAGRLQALSRLPDAGLWTSIALPEGRFRIGPGLSQATAPTELDIQAFTVLPDSPWRNRLIALLADGRIAALPMAFGRPEGPGETLHPAPRDQRDAALSFLSADDRGVFFYDPDTRALRLIRTLPPTPDVSPVSPDDSTPVP